MPKFKLTYFDINGGRAEPIRLALLLGNIDYEDCRFPFSDFATVRENTPLKQVPVFEVDGKQITQSNAISRYIGRLTGLYPTDDFQALLCDEILDAIEDITYKLVATFGMEGDALKTARESLVKGPLTRYLTWAQSKLEEQGGEYFVEQRLTIADLKIFVWVRGLLSGHLDHIPTNLVEETAPLLMQHYQRLMDNELIAQRYQ